MNNEVLAGGDVIYYALKMNGNVINERFINRAQAETNKATMLNENTCSGMNVPVIIDVVQVTADMQEVLFG